MKILNGYAGCGKTVQLSQDVNNLINSNPDAKILILTSNKYKKDVLADLINKDDIEIATIDGFIFNLYKKTPENFSNKTISDSIASYIIQIISKELLQSNDKLKNLCKSKTFSRELYNLFTLFKVNRIDVKSLCEINASADISKNDKERFDIIINIYNKYCETLKNKNLKDFRDVIFSCIENFEKYVILKDTFKSKYEYLFVQGAEDLSELQKELIFKIFDNEKIYLYADFNATTQGYMGVNAGNEADITLSNPYRNEDILNRALFILGKKTVFSSKSNSVKYVKYPDFQAEIQDIAKDIIEKIKSGDNYSDFAILIRDNSVKQNIADELNKYNLPVSSAIYNEDFSFFKYDFLRFFDFCEILEKLGLENLKLSSLTNVSYKSRADFEIYAEQFNLLFQNILSEKFENKFLLEKFNLIKERTQEDFLLTSILRHFYLLEENEKTVLNSVINLLTKLYTHYQNKNYVEFAILLSDKADKTVDYNKFLAYFISKLASLSEYSVLLNDVPDNESIRELLDFTLDENIQEENKINILTFFKSKGREFKTVYIPSLIEDYFPKKVKTTHFISQVASDILSKNIQNKYQGFLSIIPDSKLEMKDEEKLLYVAMTRAKENLILSTHDFDNSKNTIPSSFFEQLILCDSENILKQDKKNEEDCISEVIKYEENNEEISKAEKDFVVSEDDILRLSASSIKDFLDCPKKYYYSKLLNLKSESSNSANYGTIVHAVFEVLLKNYIEKFSKDYFVELGDILFNSRINPQDAIDMGFDKEDIEKVINLDELTFQETKKNFYAAINNLESTGYFLEKPIKALCEEGFEIELPQIPNVIFSGFVDAIITYPNTTKLIDYKTSKDKKALKKVFNDDEVNFINLSGANQGLFSEYKAKTYQYQIPIYYLASKNSPLFKEWECNEIGYQYVRPKYKEKGSKTDLIDITEIEKYEEKIIDNINKYVVDEIRKRTAFEITPNEQTCKWCSFGEICNKCSEESEEGEGSND